jgi:hypothetical protein
MCKQVTLVESSYGIYMFEVLLQSYRGRLKHGPDAIDYNILKKKRASM